MLFIMCQSRWKRKQQKLTYVITYSPIQVADICNKFLKDIESQLQTENISCEKNPESGTGIAFAVHNSRINADIERDLRKGTHLLKISSKIIKRELKISAWFMDTVLILHYFLKENPKRDSYSACLFILLLQCYVI